MKIYPVILAGGFGRRLAPISTPYKPKQFHDLLGHGETLLQSTIKRALMFAEPQDVITIGNVIHEEHLQTQLHEINVDLLENLIFEDEPRNTAYAINLALNHINDGILLIMPSDHFINGNFYDDVEKAVKIAAEGKIATFGIMPEYPSTNYGYLLENKFFEKPEYADAIKLIRKGALWNSGIFVASDSTLKLEYLKYSPDLTSKPPFDIAIMEKTNRMEVLRAHFNWDDLGSWESLEKFVNGRRIRLAS
jgi:mannose-1-phosphate guanylyltransferase